VHQSEAVRSVLVRFGAEIVLLFWGLNASNDGLAA
jgi:hypothetical protein